MNAVHAGRDEKEIEGAFQRDGQTAVGMLEHVGRFEQDLEDHERPKIDPEQRDGRHPEWN